MPTKCQKLVRCKHYGKESTWEIRYSVFFSHSSRLCLCAPQWSMFTNKMSRILMMSWVWTRCDYIYTFEYFLRMFSVLAYVRRKEQDATASYCCSLAPVNRLHLNRNYASTRCGSFSKRRLEKGNGCKQIHMLNVNRFRNRNVNQSHDV